MPRPVLYPDSNLMLPPKLCASVDYYAYAWQYGGYAQDWNMRFDKRDKDTHRFTIADTRGLLQLTVPIAKPQSSHCRWSEIEISTHGAWWDVHRVALESAYGGSPFFDFYIDRFIPMLTVGVEHRFPLLCRLAAAWDKEICDILGIKRVAPNSGEFVKSEVDNIEEISKLPYFQVRSDKLGFLPSLSILDLIFNLGPEAPLYLNKISNLLQ